MPWNISLLTSNSWYNLFLSLITIFSFLGMIYFYYKSKKEKRPLFYLKSTPILGDLSEKYQTLQMTYNGTKIKNLTLTQISFWNAGNETIKKDDIAIKDPISIKTKNNTQILDVKMTTSENNQNGFDYDKSFDLTTLTLIFDYIDKNQGVSFQLLHTGLSSNDVELKGSVIGVGKPKYVPENSLIPTDTTFILNNLIPRKVRRKLYNFFKIIDIIFPLILGITFLLILFSVIIHNPIQSKTDYFIIFVLLFLGVPLTYNGISQLKDWFLNQPNQIPLYLDIYTDNTEQKK
jgi:hypothetical protein